MRRVRPQQRDTIPVRLPNGREAAAARARSARRRLRLLVSERGPRLTIPPGASNDQAQRFSTSICIGWPTNWKRSAGTGNRAR